MSTQPAEVRPTGQGQRTDSTRFWIFGGIALAMLLIIAILSVSSSSSTMVTTRGASVLVLAIPAFIAGVLSFLSPCTLPILPAYFAFTFQAKQRSIVLMTVAFFLGLATTMTLLGATATALTGLLFDHLHRLTLVGGWIVIGFGIMSLLGKGFAGPQVQERPVATVAGSYLYGATFALGWTACVGPILGALLTLLGSQEGVGLLQGAVLAFIYALGLGLPLIVLATFFSRLGPGSRFWKIMRGRGFALQLGSHTLYLHTTSIASGILLIVMGSLLASGQLTTLTKLATASPLALWVIELEESINRLFGLY